MDSKKDIGWAGAFWLAGLVAGILSVAPAVDSANYLTEAAKNSDQIIVAAVFQFLMALTYMSVAILLYPHTKRFGSSLSIGFLSFRIIAASLLVIATVLLLSLLTLSQQHLQNPSLAALGNILKTARDHINHVFMVLILCVGNSFFYWLAFKARLLPRWLSAGGIVTAFLSISASILVLFQKVDIITVEYVALNVPTAVLELVLGIWLIVKGFDKRVMDLTTSPSS